MRKWMLLGMLLAAFLPLRAQTTLQQKVDAAASREPLKGALFGVMVQDMTGRVVAEREAGRRMVPASNLKLVTTGAALHALGPDFRFETGIGYTGTVEDGTLHGDVYIIGGGDPTIGAADSVAVKTDALFWRWKSLLRQEGIQRIDGRIIGDGRAYEGHLENTTWGYDDTGTYYGAGTSALSFYANAVDYAVSAGVEGGPVRVVQQYPETPWMHFTNHSVTGPAGTGNSLYLYATDLAPYAELRGTFAVGRAPKVEHFANKYGALTCAYYFWQNLRSTGWEVTGGYADIDRGGYIRGADFVPAEKAGEPVSVGVSYAPVLSKIVRETNVRSDNFYAEALFRQMGERASGVAVYDSCQVAVKEVLEGLMASPDGAKADLSGLWMEDGSGLSRQNLVSPSFMTAYLRSMTRSKAFDAFLASLPQPGEGTLTSLLPKLTPAQKSRIRIKSGSMTGVLCYSGYILDGNGAPKYVFSLMVNSATATTASIRTVLGSLIEAML
ncbi:MAG: D-alanyl-D-alanine carboxypeptidase/D-alanyl-D-alanine-endopeptidase [Bacteroidales bacterium]|nr:D-alanyl-D-alanine carboxypeptidase/D-alanyl-D-alanine-endopeptidase [Bacteroidales bacterium]